MRKNVYVQIEKENTGHLSISLQAFRECIYYIFESFRLNNSNIRLASEDQSWKDPLTSIKLHICKEEREKLSITMAVTISSGIPIHSLCRKLQLYIAEQLSEQTSVNLKEINIRVMSYKVSELND
ncbi:Asp23/Gls24 family envelope stress response protein [Alteribacter populi]|uniref:Asp23/Gls24 family envelope stress response protein n=1 Tax=Alteribacter populi TaxID=2011011 RepID=UPI000BBB10F1|nr:Asp23/Gls24 family envelope stress response protein [Alteribacter populi]